MNLRLQNLKVITPIHLEKSFNITHLDLRNNRLRKLPDEICNLILLREMKLDYNFLVTLPYGLNRLKHL